MIKFEVGKVYLSDLSCPELNVSGYVVVVSRTAKFATVKRHLPNAPVETLRKKIHLNEKSGKDIEVIFFDSNTRVMAHWAVEKPEEIEKAYRELDYKPQPSTRNEAEFDVALKRVREGQYLPYGEYSCEELMRLAEAKSLEVPAGMSREELEEAVIRAGVMDAKRYSTLWAVLMLGYASDSAEIDMRLSVCARETLEYVNVSEKLGIESVKYPDDVDFRLAVSTKLKEILEAVKGGEKVTKYGEIVKHWVETATMLRNCAVLKKIEAYLAEREAEKIPAHRDEPYAEYADEGYSDYAGDNSQPEQDIPEIYTQEEKTMTRTAISDAVTAVKEATTIEAIRDALMTCTIKDMRKVCEEITGDVPKICGQIPKSRMAQKTADFIMRYREAEEFKALTVEEKYAAMMEAQPGEVFQLVNWCRVYELHEIARKLCYSLDEEYADDPDYCAGVVYNGIRALKFERKISEQIANGADKESVKNELKLLPRGIHEALMIRAGIDPDVALSREVAIGMLATHFMKNNQPEPEINPDDTSEAEYNMLQVCIDASMSARTALKHAMKLLDPKSKDYSVLDELYYCEGRDIEEAVERRRVIHKARTALKEVRARAERQSAVA